MGFDWNSEGGSGYIKLKEGDKIELYIKSISKAKGKYNLKKGTEDLGWHVRVETDKGLISITSWGMYFCFRDNNVKAGDTIDLEFKKMGGLGKPSQYEIKVLKSEPIVEQPDANQDVDVEEIPF